MTDSILVLQTAFPDLERDNDPDPVLRSEIEPVELTLSTATGLESALYLSQIWT